MELASKSIQSNFLTCFLCSKLYEEPTTLQCLHSFCKKCILKNIQQQTSDVTKKCPVCQETIDENLEEKNTNMLLKNRVVFFKERAKNLLNPICALCRLKFQKSTMAVAQCISCLDYLCEVCSNFHNMTTLTINHQVVSLTEIKSGKYDDAIFKVTFKAFCSEHPDEEIKFYCIPCHTLTCIQCLILGHKEHEFKALDILKEDKVKAAKNILHKLNEKLETLKRNKDSMVFAHDQLKTQRTTIERKIRKKSSEAVSRIDRGKHKMLKDLDDFFLPKSKGFQIKINQIADRCKIIKQALQHSEFMFKGMSAEVVFSLDRVIKRLENLADDDSDVNDEKFKFASLNTEMSTIALKIAKPFELLLGNAGRFSKEIERKCGSPQDDNSSDFICSFADKSTQTSEVDFKICHG